MAKGRDNSGFKDGYWAGWRDFRYGNPQAKPITLAGQKPKRIFRGQKRDHVVSKAMDILRDWSQSPFEYEGIVRAGLRSTLCLWGHGWRIADNEASEIVLEGLRRIGAVRPTPEQAQREYTIGRDYCANCLGPLDAEDIARRSHFCSDDCRYAMRAKNMITYAAMERKRSSWAAKELARELAPRRLCEREGCEKFFKSTNPDARYCSLECFHLASMTRPTHTCQICGDPFRLTSSTQAGIYCSVECMSEGYRRRRVKAVCQCCGGEFEGGNDLAMYCSPSCKKFAGRVTRGEVKRITPRVFDYMVRMAA